MNEKIARVSKLLKKILDDKFINKWQRYQFMQTDDGRIIPAPIVTDDDEHHEEIQAFNLYEKTESNVIHLNLLDGHILEKCIDYMHFKYLNSKKKVPGTFTIDPTMGLEILKAAHFLEC